MKTHMKSIFTENGMPGYLKEKYHRDGYFGAVCGYMRRNVTTDADKVNCLACKKAIKDGLK